MTFAVIRVENPPEHLRGYIERFFFEIRTGLYVGTASRRVLDELWTTINENIQTGDAILVHPDSTIEAGFRVRETKHSRYKLVDYDGLTLSTKTILPEDQNEKPET